MFELIVLAICLVGEVAAAEPTHLAQRWQVETPGLLPQAVAVDTNEPGRLYVALKAGGVEILDRANGHEPPQHVASVPVSALGNLDAMNLVFRERRLYVALGDFFNSSGARAGLAVIDVSDPALPHVDAVWVSDTVLKGAAAVVTDGHYAYLGAMSQGVMIFDVLEPDTIRWVTTFLPDPQYPRKNPSSVQYPNARGLALQGSRLFVADDAGGLRVVDVSVIKTPREIGRYVNSRMGGKQQAYNNLVVDGDRAYVAVDYAGLEILDIRNLGSIRQLGWWNPWGADKFSNIWFNSLGHTNQIAYDASRRLVYLSAGDSELQVVNVADPSRPSLVADYGAPKNNRGAWGVTLGTDAVYLAYISAIVPFQSNFSGLMSVDRAQ